MAFLTDHQIGDSRAPWDKRIQSRYDAAAAQHPSASDGGGNETAATHGPIYYAALAPAYLIASGSPLVAAHADAAHVGADRRADGAVRLPARARAGAAAAVARGAGSAARRLPADVRVHLGCRQQRRRRQRGRGGAGAAADPDPAARLAPAARDPARAGADRDSGDQGNGPRDLPGRRPRAARGAVAPSPPRRPRRRRRAGARGGSSRALLLSRFKDGLKPAAAAVPRRGRRLGDQPHRAPSPKRCPIRSATSPTCGRCSCRACRSWRRTSRRAARPPS